MFRIQSQWIRPAQDAYSVFLRSISFLQCLNECNKGNSHRAAWYEKENCRLVSNEKKNSS